MTEYHVLKQQADGSFIEVGSFETSSAETANRRQANQDATGGVYLAVASSSFHISEYEPYTQTGLKKINSNARAVPKPIPGQTSLTDTDQEAIATIAGAVGA